MLRTDLTKDRLRLFDRADGAFRFAQILIGVAEIAEGISLAETIADLAFDLQVLIVEFDGAFYFAEISIGVAEIAEGISFAQSIADLA